MKLLADNEWLIRLEREHLAETKGPARKLLVENQIFLNPISLAEFMSAGITPARLIVLRAIKRIAGGVNYEDADRAAKLRFQRAKQGKTLATPDAFMAASAMRNKMRLLTADKDYSGIAGLAWSKHQD